MIPILIAARLKSKRLQKKALLTLYDKPLIIKLVERLKESKKTEKIVVCTSTNDEDTELCDLLSAHNIDYFRGDELDVMSRFIEVSKNLNAKTIVRVTGDNPLTDPEIMDEMIIKHLETKCEYTYTDDLPHGTRPEIIQTSLLNKCHNMLIEKKNTEYMTWALNRPDKFKVNKFIVSNPSLNRNDISLTVDIMKDLQLIRRIYDFYKGVPPKLSEIINFYDQIPKELKRNDKDTFITSTDVNLNFKSDL